MKSLGELNPAKVTADEAEATVYGANVGSGVGAGVGRGVGACVGKVVGRGEG